MNLTQTTREQAARITLLSEAIRGLSRGADCPDTSAHHHVAIEVMATEITRVAEQIERAPDDSSRGSYLHLNRKV